MKCLRRNRLPFFRLIGCLHDVLYEEFTLNLKEMNSLTEDISLYLKELKEFSLLRKEDIININRISKTSFHFDFATIMKNNFIVDPMAFKLPEPVEYTIAHDEEQKKMIGDCIKEYGTSIDGLSRVIMFRIHYKKLFRGFQVAQNSPQEASVHS